MIEESKYKATNNRVITYIEDPYGIENFIGKKKLVIIFQSLGNEKSENLNERYPYTLLNGLKYFNCRKIYIKDDQGIVGDYYLGINGSFDTKDAILEFLNKKVKEYEILKEDIICLGFSKGGYAALMYGFELGVGTIISGVPQYRLWEWIKKYKPFLDYILPLNYKDEDKNFYNNLLDLSIKRSKNNPKVILITSNNDNTYDDHIPFLIETLTFKKVDYILYKNNEAVVTQHNNVVKASLNEIMLALSWSLSPLSLKKEMRV